MLLQKNNKTAKSLFFLSIILVPFLLISFILNNNNKLIYTIPFNAISIVAEDLDLDGDNDIITGHQAVGYYSDTGVVILRNDSLGLLNSTYESLQLLGYQHDIIVTDLTNNQYPEIVAFKTDFGNPPGLYVRVYYNSNGVFNQFADFPLNISKSVWAKTYGDIDGDNDIDILITSSNAYKWGIMTNNGSGILSAPEYFDIAYPPHDIDCADMNNDFMNDVIISGVDNTIFLNTGTGFEEILLDESLLQDAVVADMDNNGNNDITGIVAYGNTILYIYENNWDTTFTKHTALVYDSVLYNPVVGDINNDSLPDVICTSFSGVFVLKNNGDYTLQLPDYYPFPINCYVAGHAYCSDLNNDGWMDIAAVLPHPTELTTQLMTLFNDGTGHFVQTPVTQVENPKQNPILRCYPNPFHKKVAITFKIDNKAFATLRIIDLSGKEIKIINESILKNGIHEFSWDGTNNNGQSCSKGVYMLMLEVDKITEVKKLLFN